MNTIYTVDEVIGAIKTNNLLVLSAVGKDIEVYKNNINDIESEDCILFSVIENNSVDFFKIILPILDFNKKNWNGDSVIVGLIKENTNHPKEHLIEVFIEYAVDNNIPYRDWGGHYNKSKNHLKIDKEVIYNDVTIEVSKMPYGINLRIFENMDEQLNNDDCFWYFNRMMLYLPTSKQQEMLLEISHYLHDTTDDVNKIKSKFVQMLFVFDESINIESYYHTLFGLKPILMDILSARIEKEILDKDIEINKPQKGKLKL